ncbi:MAG: glycosidase [Myxococcales bacterium]|nr:MAG: glycosidase [Myxococcales bacterium]
MEYEKYKELFLRHDGNPILTRDQMPYSANSVFNPAAAIVDGETLLLLRVEDRSGLSHLTVARSKNGITGWRIDEQPTFCPDPENHPEEIWGVEDPRITYLEEEKRWIVAYTAFSRGGPLVALATTEDFCTFERLGPVTTPDDKDAALFPVRFGGRWALLHRPMTAGIRMGAHIWISFSPDLKHWGDHQILLHARDGAWWDANKIGLSPPPLKTDRGWLLLYHGVRNTAAGCLYRLGLALLDLENPTHVLRRSKEWVFGPREHYERTGDVADVVFPCGWVLDGEEVRIYYGAADTSIGLATANIHELFNHLDEQDSKMNASYWPPNLVQFFFLTRR